MASCFAVMMTSGGHVHSDGLRGGARRAKKRPRRAEGAQNVAKELENSSRTRQLPKEDSLGIRDVLPGHDVAPDPVVSDADVANYLQNAGFNPVKTVAPSKGDAPTSPEPATRKRSDGLRQKEILQFERVGHMLARNLLSEDEVLELRGAVLDVFDRRKLDSYQQKCTVLGLGEPASIAEAEQMLAKVNPEMVPFLQLFNLRKGGQGIAIPPAVCKAAADLLGTKKLRIYQDSEPWWYVPALHLSWTELGSHRCFDRFLDHQLFVKRQGDGPTLWHSDLNMAPLDTNDFVTAWIPLQHVPEESSALHFASKSHRDFSACYWRGREFLRGADLSTRYKVDTYSPLWAGDVTFHHGWTLHAAPGLDGNAATRFAFTVSFFAEESTRLLPESFSADVETEDKLSYAHWIKDDIDPDKPLQHDELELVNIYLGRQALQGRDKQ